MVPQGWTLPSELDKIPGYLATWEKRPSWENTYYTVSDSLARFPSLIYFVLTVVYRNAVLKKCREMGDDAVNVPRRRSTCRMAGR